MADGVHLRHIEGGCYTVSMPGDALNDVALIKSYARLTNSRAAGPARKLFSCKPYAAFGLAISSITLAAIMFSGWVSIATHHRPSGSCPLSHSYAVVT